MSDVELLLELTDDHVFHRTVDGSPFPGQVLSPSFGHRLDWSPRCSTETCRWATRWGIVDALLAIARLERALGVGA